MGLTRYSTELEGGSTMTDAGVAFAADVPGKTGLYLSLSCYYQDAAPGTSVPVLDEIGAFSVTGTGRHDDVHIVAVHPGLVRYDRRFALELVLFGSRGVRFLPRVTSCQLVIANRCRSRGAIRFARRFAGAPDYVLARGETLSPVSCGDGQTCPVTRGVR